MENFQQVQPQETFCFLCHPAIACFNQCCRDLNQYLTPYDIVRLKNRLGLPSQQFLARYTVSHIGPRSGLPVVSLKMLQDDDMRCPFVSPAGCTVYEDRPSACRTYPLGRMATRKQGQHVCEDSYFIIREKHCLGFHESKAWTVETWKANQQIEIYNKMNDLMVDVLSLKNRSGKKCLTKKEAQRFFMACYDLDRFRDFVVGKGLLGPLAAAGGKNCVIPEDDVALMRFAIDWIKANLF